jgi:hypothetical protein
MPPKSPESLLQILSEVYWELFRAARKAHPQTQMVATLGPTKESRISYTGIICWEGGAPSGATFQETFLGIITKSPNFYMEGYTETTCLARGREAHRGESLSLYLNVDPPPNGTLLSVQLFLDVPDPLRGPQ